MSVTAEGEILFQIKNPVSRDWMQAHLRAEHPRLILTPEIIEAVRGQVGTEGPAALVYDRIRSQADQLLDQPPAERNFTGRRLLYVSREVLGRTTALALAWLVEKNPSYLERLEMELQAVCRFEDWNPSHFLDVAEMATAVALPLDWCGDAMSGETRELAKEALLNNALLPGLADSRDNWWINAQHNWNLVCHGGLAIAALAVFEDHPGLAARVLKRSFDKIPLGLQPYAPDGAYSEGPTYWFYATDYLTLTLSACRTALRTDFGLVDAPGLKQSALSSLLLGGPSGDLYKYADAGKGGYLDFDHIGLLAWFMPYLKKTLPAEVWKCFPEAVAAESIPIDRMSVMYLVNLVAIPVGLPPLELPRDWVAGGPAPVGVLRPLKEEGMYLAAKGGSASDNHAHMDAGSFILEWRRIRWSVDPGKLDYTAVEATIGVNGLWNIRQDSPRWDYIAHNNFGHSTLTVNDGNHCAEGRVLVCASDLESATPSFSFDMTPLFPDAVESARRTFRRLSDDAVQIVDTIRPNAGTESLRWQLITTAGVALTSDGVGLLSNGKRLNLVVREPEVHEIRTVPLAPPPRPHDVDIPGLKRIEILVTPRALEQAGQRIVIELSGQD